MYIGLIIIGVLLFVSFFLFANDANTNAKSANRIKNLLMASTFDTNAMTDSGTGLYLVEGRSGARSYKIKQNACHNGARLVATLVDTSKEKENTLRTLNISGLMSTKKLNILRDTLDFTNNESKQIMHLPATILRDNSTDYLEYTIAPGRNAEDVRYDIICY